MNLSIPSKINLFLKVTGRRADGYHELVSLFLPLAAPCDRITWTDLTGAGLRVASNVPGLPADAANLAGRAALAYAERAGIAPSWQFDIHKDIPIAAGMGGGSADAAAVLRLLQRRYQALSDAELRALALTLGADVPFFLDPALAVATGVGEELRRAGTIAAGLPLVLIEPGFPVSARWAYTHLAPERIGPVRAGQLEALIAALQCGDWARAAREIHNDLAAALWDKFPLLTILRDFFLARGAAGCEVTGSGPVLYAIFPDPALAAAALQEARAEFPELGFRRAAVDCAAESPTAKSEDSRS